MKRELPKRIVTRDTVYDPESGMQLPWDLVRAYLIAPTVRPDGRHTATIEHTSLVRPSWWPPDEQPAA